MLSINNDDSFLFERDISGLQQCTTEYMITKADGDIFSIVFTEQLVTTEHTQNSCRGITVDTAHCYYMEENAVNLIVPLNHESGGYVVLCIIITSNAEEETESTEYPIETVYTDEDYDI